MRDVLVVAGIALVAFIVGLEVGVRWTARRYQDQLTWMKLRGPR